MKLEVFIVDDDKMSILINRNMVLKSNFHETPTSFLNSSESFNHILENNSGDITYCILLDINMPKMSGWNFLDAINQHNIVAPLLVIMVSSSVDIADKLKAGAYPQVIAFLEKPITVDMMMKLKKHHALKLFFN